MGISHCVVGIEVTACGKNRLVVEQNLTCSLKLPQSCTHEPAGSVSIQQAHYKLSFFFSAEKVGQKTAQRCRIKNMETVYTKHAGI